MGNNHLTMEQLIEKITFLTNIYDAIRIVDPIKKKVHYFISQNEEKLKEEDTCFAFWKQGKICSNCISMRAYTTDKTFIKIEYNGERLYLVTATPFYTEVGKIVVEFLKDSTDSGIIEDIKNLATKDIYDKVNKLNELVVRDSLTGVYNRRFIEDRLPVDLLAASLNKRPLSIIIADIDFFKKVNDTYGHVAGDEVLKFLASLLQNSIRKTDWVARYGGEEFLICLNNADDNLAYEIAERIRKKVEDSIIMYKDWEIRITASFGVYTVKSENETYIDIIEKADQNLYKAKKEGRNRVIV